MLTALRRVFKAGFVGFWRNMYVSLASVFVITVALFVIGITMLVDQLLMVSLENIQSKVDINVSFTNTATEEDVLAVKSALEAMPEVEAVTYKSAEDALADFRSRYASDSITLQALEYLDENPLGATLAILAKDTSQYGAIAQFLEERKAEESPQNPVIYAVNFTNTREAIDNLTAIITAGERASFITLMVLIGAAVLITFNTIRLAIYTSREEIAVMRLVGASNMFIRGPFMLQGMMYGLVSGLLALAILYPIVVWLGPKTLSFFQFDLEAYFLNDFSYIFAVLVGIGMSLGLVSSAFAIARYLRV